MVATRRSGAILDGEEGNISVMSSASSAAEHGARAPPPPHPLPPPPPPPPPLPTPTTTRDNSNQPQEQHQEQQDTNQEVNQPSPPNEFLQVRVPLQSPQPYRVRRRHHQQYHQPTPNGSIAPLSNNIKQRPPSKSSKLSQSTEGEIVRVLIPTGGFCSERQLSECLSQASAVDFQGRNTTYDDDASWDSTDEYYDDRLQSSINVAVSEVVV